MSETNTLSEFLKTNCDMSGAVVKKVFDALEKKGIDGLMIATAKARNGGLKPILEEILKEEGVDEDYVGIILTQLGKRTDKESDEKLANMKKEVDAALQAAREYRQAAATQNKETLDSAYSKLDGALQKVAPDAGWNVPSGANLLPKMDQLIKDITSLTEVVASGDYGSDLEMLPQISGGALCKASIFLPGRPIGRRAVAALFKLPSDITKNVLSETNIYEAAFSNNAVAASYQNDLTLDGSANTLNAEGGAFFGVGAFAVSGSYSGGSASDRASRINTLSETREAVGIKVHTVGKASVNIRPDAVLFDYARGAINSVDAAKNFFDMYGTHVIVAPQVLGGLYILRSTVNFNSNVSQSSYTEALSKTLSVSAGASGWGVFDGGMFGASGGGGYDTTNTEAHAGGTTTSGDTYSASTTITMKGPSCVNAASFRASLNNGNKSWCFVNNGLKLDPQNRDNVVNQIVPVWELFERAGRKEEALFLRNTWLDIVVDTDAVIDPNSFFSKLVNKTLFVDSLSADEGKRDWTRPFASKLAALRTPISVFCHDEGVTPYSDGNSCLRDLSPHAVGFHDNRVLTRFHLGTDGDRIHYDYTVACLSGCGQFLTTREVEAKTGANKRENEICCYLDRHFVMAPEGHVLTGFQLERDGIQVWIRYRYTQLFAGDVKFTYRASDNVVQQSGTGWNDGADKAMVYLDRQNVAVPDGHLMVGFHLVDQGGNMRYDFWHVPATALKPEVLFLGK